MVGQAATGLLDTLRPSGMADGGWVLVAVPASGGAHRQRHLRERSLTAVQRFMLALACEDVGIRWVAEPPGAVASRTAGVDLVGHGSVGLVWCGPG